MKKLAIGAMMCLAFGMSAQSSADSAQAVAELKKKLEKLEQTTNEWYGDMKQKLQEYEARDEPMSDSVREAYQARMEAQAEEIERHMDAWSEEMDAWAEEYGPQMEAWGQTFGEQMGAWGEEFGKRMEVWSREMAKEMEKMKMPPLPDIPPPPAPPVDEDDKEEE